MPWPASAPAGARPRGRRAAGGPRRPGRVPVPRRRSGASARAEPLAGALLALPLVVAWPPAVVLVPILGAAGGLAPTRWLGRREAARRRALVRELPDLLDLLGICVESGMALDPALRLAVERLGGTLGAEFERVLRDLALGTPRVGAYRALVERAGCPELARTVGALLQAEELGAPLSRALEGQAEALRVAPAPDGARARGARGTEDPARRGPADGAGGADAGPGRAGDRAVPAGRLGGRGPMSASVQRGSATVDYLAAVAAVGLLMLALVVVREHRPHRRPPVNPVAHIGALVRPPSIPRPPVEVPRPRPRARARPAGRRDPV